MVLAYEDSPEGLWYPQIEAVVALHGREAVVAGHGCRGLYPKMIRVEL